MRNGLNLPFQGQRFPNARDELRTLNTESLRKMAAAERKPPYLDAWLNDELNFRHGGREPEATPLPRRGVGPRWAKPRRP